jgi:adenosylcobyric acid synthase
VAKALADLRGRFDLVVIEGAGSPAEVNLREGEIVNMRVAAAARAPVLLTADVERGGVFAALLGTLDLLEPDERALVRGLLVNRFRGDPTLFDGGVDFLQRRSGLPVVGVVPYLDVRLPAEDSLELDLLRGDGERSGGARLDVAVVHLGRISNFDELQPLAGEPAVRLRLVRSPQELGRPDLVVLPGTKTTVADLGWLRESGLAGAILAARGNGAAVLGICGGYQMLGVEIRDPEGVESSDDATGLGLLPVRTIFGPAKVTSQRQATVIPRAGLLGRCAGLRVPGYEIHMGRMLGDRRPAFDLDTATEGSVSEDGWVVGSSLHGLLGDHRFRRGLLEGLAERKGIPLPPATAPPPDPYDRLADALEACLDVGLLDRLVGLT